MNIHLKNVNRIYLIQCLLTLSQPLMEITEKLAGVEWDYEGECVELRKEHLRSALQKYLDGILSGEDIELWANQIESREDIEFEASAEREIQDVLYQLANPLLTRPLGFVEANDLISKLRL